MCSVFMQESEKVVSVSSDHLEPVTPTKNNKVRPPFPASHHVTIIIRLLHLAMLPSTCGATCGPRHPKIN